MLKNLLENLVVKEFNKQVLTQSTLASCSKLEKIDIFRVCKEHIQKGNL